VCFFVLVVYGLFEFYQQISTYKNRILLFSSNPIPAGSLLILLSLGPLSLLTLHKSSWKRKVLVSGLILGVLVTILIGQRGPLLALFGMAFLWVAMNRKWLLVFSLTTVIVAGTVYQFRDQIPDKYQYRMQNKETLLVRLEFYPIALNVLKEKPLFGLGFNSSLSRFIPDDYESKFFPRDGKHSFYGMSRNLNIFDNMALTFLGETGGLFSAAYICLIVFLIKNKASIAYRNKDKMMRSSFLLIVLVGFMADSMTFDSLKYPHLNWIFHSILGLLAQREVIRKKP
jgi:O-antigen ligase